MFIVAIILLILAGLMLIGAILIQPGKGDMAAGMGSSFGGQFGSMIGMRKAADVLVKTTIGLALGIMLVIVVVNKFLVSPEETTGTKLSTQGMEQPANTPAQSQPAQQAQPAQSQPAQQAQPAQAQPKPAKP
ncbi:MAG: preprotein translocase subunit SecG [Candidatus Kapabacteria bacterium]|nr:preprotein translocase subunit SecG [Candidatus Kapabacteria bacterium]